MEGLAAEAAKIGFFLDAYKKAAESAVSANDRVSQARAALTAAPAYHTPPPVGRLLLAEVDDLVVPSWRCA